ARPRPAPQARGRAHSHCARRRLRPGGGVNWRPLDRVPSIKLKLGSVIVAAVAVSAVVSTIGLRLGIPLYLRPVIAIVLSLGMVQLLARGMTSPLREMAAASREMAR